MNSFIHSRHLFFRNEFLIMNYTPIDQTISVPDTSKPFALMRRQQQAGSITVTQGRAKRTIQAANRPKRRRLVPYIPDDLECSESDRIVLPHKVSRLAIRRQPVEFDSPSGFFGPSAEACGSSAELSADDSTAASCTDSILLPTMEALDDARSSSLAASGVGPLPLKPRCSRFQG